MPPSVHDINVKSLNMYIWDILYVGTYNIYLINYTYFIVYFSEANQLKNKLELKKENYKRHCLPE